jgi:ketosteroid isomerase-like protein
MRMFVSTLLALGISLQVTLGAEPRAPAAIPSSAAESALRKLDETSLAGIRKRDVKFVDAVYAPDVVMFPPYGQFKVEGLDLVREAWKSLYNTFAAITRCEWSERRYHASGNQAWMTCLWYLEGTNSDGQSLELVLRVTRHYENRRGRWLVVHEHASAPMR